MATRFKSVIALLAVVMVVATAACASEPLAPTPNIEATVDARVAQERATETPDPTPNIEATIEAGIAATMVVLEIEKAVKATMVAPSAVEHLNRAETYLDMGEYENAIQVYDKAIQLDPNNAGAYYLRGYSYFELGQYRRAIQDYDKAIKLGPRSLDLFAAGLSGEIAQFEFAGYYASRGEAYRRLGNDYKADRDQVKACSLSRPLC